MGHAEIVEADGVRDFLWTNKSNTSHLEMKTITLSVSFHFASINFKTSFFEHNKIMLNQLVIHHSILQEAGTLCEGSI